MNARGGNLTENATNVDIAEEIKQLNLTVLGNVTYTYHSHTSACAGYAPCGSNDISIIQGSWNSASQSYINSGRHCNTCGYEQKGGAKWSACPQSVWKAVACGKDTTTIESATITY